MAELNQVLKEQLATLPPVLQEILGEFDWAKKIGELGSKYNLHIDQMGILQLETMYTLVGLSDFDDYRAALQKGIPLDAAKLEELLDDANNMIFRPIREEVLRRSADTPPEENEIAFANEVDRITNEVLTEEKTQPSEGGETASPPPPSGTPPLQKKAGDEVDLSTPVAISDHPSRGELSTKLGVKTVADILKEEKTKNLLGLINLPKTETDYSVPKITDPYREKPE